MEITELQKDLAAVFRWTARLNMNEGIANHFSVCLPSSNNFYVNTLTGLLINLYNLLSIMLATQFYNNTQVQILIIMFNSFFYIFVYLRLKK